jgi:hypothetical protein
VPRWRDALVEIHRVLRQGGRLYAEEVFAPFLQHPLWSRLLEHPGEDRFDHDDFQKALEEAGFQVIDTRRLGRGFGWFVADRVQA